MAYGAKINAKQLHQQLLFQIQSNRKLHRKAKAGIPLCIWGIHGIGKTEIVRAFAKEKGFQLIDLAPAQFEEMGDLIGMPQISNGTTVLRPPSWVPSRQGPGILLLDDFNRADDRIIRGLMPLLQDGAMISWSLPADWHILLTANPDQGDYSVTPLDEALISRMRHVELEFEVESWAKWAQKARIPNFLIDFTLLFPEIIKEGRSTARSVSQFFESLQNIEDLAKQKDLVSIVASSYLDDLSVNQFLSYLNAEAYHLPSAQTILNSNYFEKEVQAKFQKLFQDGILRLDILNTVWDRLYRYLQQNSSSLNSHHLNNLETFLKMAIIPIDQRRIWVAQLIELKHRKLEQFLHKGDWTAFLL